VEAASWTVERVRRNSSHKGNQSIEIIAGGVNSSVVAVKLTSSKSESGLFGKLLYPWEMLYPSLTGYCHRTGKCHQNYRY